MIAIFGVAQTHAYWSEPDAVAPESTSAAPIRTGSPGDTILQSKPGLLTANSELFINGLTNTTFLFSYQDVNVNGSLCLNAQCIYHWSELREQYVHLSPAGSPDTGYISVVGTDSGSDFSRVVPSNSQFGVGATAGVPTAAGNTVAIVGQSSEVETASKTTGAGGAAANVSYCTGGDRRECSASSPCPAGSGSCEAVSSSAGVYGSSVDKPNAWAGRFEGRVGIEGELCLNGDCISSWDTPGDAGNVVRVQKTSQPIVQTGLVNVEGSYQGGDLVLGTPDLSTSATFSCGDGICNYGNNGEDLVSCPADCSCGDGVCNYGETPATCSNDCS